MRKNISILLLVGNISSLVIFVARMFPEKAILIILIKLIVSAAAYLACRGSGRQDLCNYILLGSLLGIILGYWDEVVLQSIWFMWRFIIIMVSLSFIALGVFLYVQNKSQES